MWSQIDEISPQSLLRQRESHIMEKWNHRDCQDDAVLKDVENKVMVEGRFINENLM